MRRTLLRLTITAAGLCAAVVVLEAALRATRPAVAYQYAPQRIILTHFIPSDYLPSELKRNFQGRFRMLEFDTTVTTNSWGLRDREIDFSKPRLLCLGDSFAFGFGVEDGDAFCARLEDQFAGRYDVVNAGIPGGSPDTYALWLSRHRDKLQPQSVLVNLFQNDITDVHDHRWEPDNDALPQRIVNPGTIVTSDGASMRDNAVARLPPALRTLIKESYIVAILRDRLLRDADASPAAAAPPTPASAGASTAVHTDPRFMRSLKFLADAAGTTPVVIHLIPSNGQTQDSNMDRTVKQFAADRGWPVVQEYAPFTPADYFKQDGHWLPSGHQKAAAYLHRALVRLGF